MSYQGITPSTAPTQSSPTPLYGQLWFWLIIEAAIFILLLIFLGWLYGQCREQCPVRGAGATGTGTTAAATAAAKAKADEAARVKALAARTAAAKPKPKGAQVGIKPKTQPKGLGLGLGGGLAGGLGGGQNFTPAQLAFLRQQQQQGAMFGGGLAL